MNQMRCTRCDRYGFHEPWCSSILGNDPPLKLETNMGKNDDTTPDPGTADVLTKVIKLLEPLSDMEKRRVLDTAAVFLKINERYPGSVKR